MQKRNWKEYNKQLIQRGNITFFVNPKILTCDKPRQMKKGRPLEFSDQFIIMLMMVKVHFCLPYRTLEGVVGSILSLMPSVDSIPCYSLICKRANGMTSKLICKVFSGGFLLFFVQNFGAKLTTKMICR